MKLRALIILSLVLCTAVLAVNKTAFADADSTDRASRCVAAQGYIDTTLKNQDLRARVDRLQAYQYISQRLDEFTTRLERNHQPIAAELRQNVVTINQSIDSFKRDYESYNVARDKVANLVDCKNHMEDFQAKLTDAREKRAKVAADVEALQAILSPDTENHLNDLYAQLLASGRSIGAQNE